MNSKVPAPLTFKERQYNEYLANQKAIIQMFTLESYFMNPSQEVVFSGPACCLSHEAPSKKTQLLFALNPFVMNCCFNIETSGQHLQTCIFHQSKSKQFNVDNVFQVAKDSNNTDGKSTGQKQNAKDSKKKSKDRY